MQTHGPPSHRHQRTSKRNSEHPIKTTSKINEIIRFVEISYIFYIRKVTAIVTAPAKAKRTAAATTAAESAATSTMTAKAKATATATTTATTTSTATQSAIGTILLNAQS